MGVPTDITIIDRTGVPVVLVEAKTKLGTTPDWAAAARRSLAAHGFLPPARFFVLATPDRFYFWFDKAADPSPVPPDFSFDSSEAIRPYLEKAGVEAGSLSVTGLELIMAAWLGELARGIESARVPAAAAASLRDSGFFEVVRDGQLKLE